MSDIIRLSPGELQGIIGRSKGKSLEAIDKRDGYIALLDALGNLVNQDTPREFIGLIVNLYATDPLPPNAKPHPSLKLVLDALNAKVKSSITNQEGYEVAVYDPAGNLVSKTAFAVFRQVVVNLYEADTQSSK